MSSLIRPVGSQATVTPVSATTEQYGNISFDRDDNLVIVKNDGEEVIYEYPIHSDGVHQDVTDDGSLAARDSLALATARYDHNKPPSVVGGRNDDDELRIRRRRALLLVACCILVGIIALTAVLTNNNNSSSDEEAESQENAKGDNVFENPTSAPTWTPISLSKSVLGSVVSNASALDDPTTPEGQAFNIVSSEDLGEPNVMITRYSLLTAFFAMNGNDWANNQGWATHSADHCGWHGNACETPGVITKAVLDNNNLIGYIPEDVCLLTSMETLILSANLLDGTLPKCISNMTKLKELHVNGNVFKGELPAGLHALSDLARLTLSSNEFSGPLSALFNDVQPGDPVFPSLVTLNLDDNQISGTIPDDKLAQATALLAMTFHDNPLLSGTLTQTCLATRTILATADCNLVTCPCCNDGNDCL